jgi:hypothetical protein
MPRNIALDTDSLTEDLKLAKKIAGPVAKAFVDDGELLTAAADGFETAVEGDASVPARARGSLPEAKRTKRARLRSSAARLPSGGPGSRARVRRRGRPR